MEAHGHFVADIAALAYGDSPERVEEAAIPLEWLAGVASALAVLQVPAEIKSLVDETVQRASMMLNIATVRRECSKKAPEAILTKWSDVWKMMQRISTTVGLADNHPLASLRMICTKIAMVDIEKPIVDFVEALANSDMCGAVTTAVMTTADELRALLPPKVGNLIDSVRAFVSLKQTADQITEGKSAGLLQCSAVLRKATGLVDLITQRDAYTEAYNLVRVEFNTKLQEVLAKCDLTNVEASKTKYSRVTASIASWEFGADVSWLRSSGDDSTGPSTSETKHIEQFASAYPTTLRIVEELHAMGDNMTWATEDQMRGGRCKGILEQCGQARARGLNPPREHDHCERHLDGRRCRGEQDIHHEQAEGTLAMPPLDLEGQARLAQPRRQEVLERGGVFGARERHERQRGHRRGIIFGRSFGGHECRREAHAEEDSPPHLQVSSSGSGG